MRKKYRTLGEPSDIAFLLIIFFLLMVGVSDEHVLTLFRESEVAPSEKIPLVIEVQSDGSLIKEGKVISKEQLRKEALNYSELHLHISETCRWQEVVTLLAEVEELSIGLSLEVLQ